MIYYIFSEFIAVVLIFAVSVLLHELGHALIIKKYTGKFPKIGYRKVKKVRELYYNVSQFNDCQKKEMIFWGVWLGFLLLILFSNFVNWFSKITLFVLYFWGCKHDLTVYYNIFKEHRRKK